MLLVLSWAVVGVFMLVGPSSVQEEVAVIGTVGDEAGTKPVSVAAACVPSSHVSGTSSCVPSSALRIGEKVTMSCG